MKTRLIGLNGHIGSGKSTVARYLIENLPNKFVERSFAYKLKQVVSVMSGLSIDDMFTQDGKNSMVRGFGMTVGSMQQIIGTDVMRSWDENVWIKALFADYNESSMWVVSDVRFKNEADKIKSMGGILIRLNGDPAGVRAKSTRNLDHPSETDLDRYHTFDIIYDTLPGTEHLKELLELVLSYDRFLK